MLVSANDINCRVSRLKNDLFYLIIKCINLIYILVIS